MCWLSLYTDTWCLSVVNSDDHIELSYHHIKQNQIYVCTTTTCQPCLVLLVTIINQLITTPLSCCLKLSTSSTSTSTLERCSLSSSTASSSWAQLITLSISLAGCVECTYRNTVNTAIYNSQTHHSTLLTMSQMWVITAFYKWHWLKLLPNTRQNCTKGSDTTFGLPSGILHGSLVENYAEN